MEIEGYIGSIIYMQESPDVRYFGINYGPLALRYIVLWTDRSSDQYPYAADAYNHEYKVGIRYDRETKELLAIWKGK